MATLKSALALEDRMSKPLFNIENRMTKLQQVMERARVIQKEHGAENIRWQDALRKASQELGVSSKGQDKAEKSIKNLNNSASESPRIFGKFSQSISDAGAIAKKAFSGISKVTAVGLGAAATALGGLVVKSLQFGAEMEQNIGGSEAVFGEFAETVGIKSRAAFETMGVSASDYLATANKMTSLMRGSGIGIEQSMEMSTAAMQRAADVASIMGIDTQSAMESIAGAAKGNFTMMDNLGVAMNATTIEAYAMSKGLNTAYKDMDNASKIGLAMEMFLKKTTYATGNYARENATLSGALTTAKAAMTNFMTGAGTVGDLVKSSTNLSEVVLKNLSVLLPSLTEGISGVVHGLIPQIPPLIEQLLPSVMQGTVTLISGLVSILPQLIGAAVSAAPSIVSLALSQVPETIRQYLIAPFFAAGAFIFKHIHSVISSILPVLAILGVAALIVGTQMMTAWIMANLPLVAMIAVIVGLATLFDKFGIKISQVSEFIGGAIGAAVAIVWNLFSGLGELVLGVINFMYNLFLPFAFFIGNFLKDPVSSIIYLFQGMADAVLGILEKIASALDFVFGSKMADSVQGWRNGLKDMADEAVKARGFDPAEFRTDRVELSMASFGLERMETGATAKQGAAIGKNIGGKIESGLESFGDLLSKGLTGLEPKPTPGEKMPPIPGAAFDNLSNFDFDSNGNLKTANQNEIKITDEDIKMLHDIALRRVDMTYQQVTPQVTVNATVREEADFDRLADTFADSIDEAATAHLDILLGV